MEAARVSAARRRRVSLYSWTAASTRSATVTSVAIATSVTEITTCRCTAGCAWCHPSNVNATRSSRLASPVCAYAWAPEPCSYRGAGQRLTMRLSIYRWCVFRHISSRPLRIRSLALAPRAIAGRRTRPTPFDGLSVVRHPSASWRHQRTTPSTARHANSSRHRSWATSRCSTCERWRGTAQDRQWEQRERTSAASTCTSAAGATCARTFRRTCATSSTRPRSSGNLAERAVAELHTERTRLPHNWSS